MFHHDPNHSDAALEEMHAAVEQQTGRRIDVAAENLVVANGS
jgi:hypothetical protein